ncbi:hypothetical protein [Selenomonas ruminantium]|uniref:SLH domain-containing protein n=1 Tax=Selenomonas ruminantium TaxID=971 RepID=A0A1H0SEU5_SELRU|nr:hypothetical protein [Selenomonas ruminantium]SDP40331.1 hypothetical protein SAMN05216366_11741 [Selenomonas ruminantium]
MRSWMNVGKIGAAAVMTAAVMSYGQSAEAANGFLAEVPVGDWSYSAVNELITAKVVPDYAVAIPEGRVLSRLEMAMIVDSAMKNQANMTDVQQAALNKLNNEYYYDIKKLTLLNRLDNLDNNQMDKLNNQQAGETFTKEEKAGLKKAAALADKLSINGYARIRNDHFLTEERQADGSKKLNRKTRANMVHIAVNSTYKVNDNWAAHADIGYRNSFSGFDELRRGDGRSPSENETGITIDGYVTGKFPKLGLDAKIGKWNEWNIYGWGMDIDCDFSGIQLVQGKKKFKTFFTGGQMDLWDGVKNKEKVTSLRFFYPFDDKNDINFGTSWSSPMTSRYQDTNGRHRVFYYYTHAHHKFDNNWSVRAGIINSNAHRDQDNIEVAGKKTKKPGRWLQIDYKGAKLDKPNTYGITLDYRYEPALSWPTVTDWCSINSKFLRLGFSYVPAKNILLDTFYTWQRDIDTNDRNDLYRFQAQFFF